MGGARRRRLELGRRAAVFPRLENDQNFHGPLHGSDGPVPLRRIASGWPPFVEGVFAAVADLGYKNLHDQNGAFGDGYFPIAISNIDDHRVSTAMAYLTPRRPAAAEPVRS